jgi:hypothetical protein
MEFKKCFINNIDELESLEEDLKKILNVDAELPANVFNESYNCYLFNDWEWITYEAAWPTLKYLAENANDNLINVVVLDPHPLISYFREYQHSNWAKIPISFTSEQYEEIIHYTPDEDGIDSIYQNTRTVIWFSPSKDWIIYGDWELEICVFACRSNKCMADSSFLKNWLDVNDIKLYDYLAAVTVNRKTPKEIWNQLKQNYSF